MRWGATRERFKQMMQVGLKHRLQQLDEFEEHVSKHKRHLMDDYVPRVTQISHELQQAWDLDQ